MTPLRARPGLALGLLDVAAALPAAAPKLVIRMVGDAKVTRVTAPAVQAFVLGHPGVAVELRDVPWADAMSKYSAALVSRAGPDLNQRAPDLVKLLIQYAVPGLLPSVRRPDGVMHAAPVDMHLQLQFYRTDLLAMAPATYAEFEAAVRQRQAIGARGCAQQWGKTNWLGFFPDLLLGGGALYDAQCTKALVDTPEAGRALHHCASIYRQLKASTDTWPDADGGLESEATPLIQSGSWQRAVVGALRFIQTAVEA